MKTLVLNRIKEKRDIKLLFKVGDNIIIYVISVYLPFSLSSREEHPSVDEYSRTSVQLVINNANLDIISLFKHPRLNTRMSRVFIISYRCAARRSHGRIYDRRFARASVVLDETCASANVDFDRILHCVTVQHTFAFKYQIICAHAFGARI